jgi:hypothetical protein
MSITSWLSNFKPIKQRYQLLLFVVAWLFCNEVLSRVLFDNLEHDIYPMESDSIGIPMMENLFLGFIVGFLCVLGVVIPKTKIWGVVSIASIGLGTLMTLQGVAYWMIPNQYIASIGHLVPFIVCMYMLVSAWATRKQALSIQVTTNEQAS